MFSSERSTLSVARAFDLGAVLPPPPLSLPARTTEHESQDIPANAQRFLHFFHIFSLNLCFALGIGLPLSVRLVVLAICSLLVQRADS